MVDKIELRKRRVFIQRWTSENFSFPINFYTKYDIGSKPTLALNLYFFFLTVY